MIEQKLISSDLVEKMAIKLFGCIPLINEGHKMEMTLREFIADVPTINTEELSLVKELRAEIEKLNAEIADRERSSIEEHGEVHYWRDRARELEKELAVTQNAQGHWIPNPSMDDLYYSYYTCSHCNQLVNVNNKCNPYQAMPYCHCGAMMIKEEK